MIFIFYQLKRSNIERKDSLLSLEQFKGNGHV